MDIKVSIIIPAYNIEKYIEESILSSINQTLKEIEIIIINDGSTDRTLEVIKKYKKIDSRIKLIDQKNQGVSIARNNGLEIARGKYIYFLDGDDWIENETLNECYNIAENLEIDIIHFNSLKIEEKTKIKNFSYTKGTNLDENKIYIGEEFVEECFNKNIFRGEVWFNFIKRELIENLKLKFYPGISYEDILFTMKLQNSNYKIKYLNKIFHNYRIREKSITQSKFSFDKYESKFIIFNELKKELKNSERIKKKNYRKLIEVIVESIISLGLTNNYTSTSIYKIIKKEKEFISKKTILKMKLSYIYKLYSNIRK